MVSSLSREPVGTGVDQVGNGSLCSIDSVVSATLKVVVQVSIDGRARLYLFSLKISRGWNPR